MGKRRSKRFDVVLGGSRGRGLVGGGGPGTRKGGRRVLLTPRSAALPSRKGVMAPFFVRARAAAPLKGTHQPPFSAPHREKPSRRPGPAPASPHAPHMPHESRISHAREEQCGCGCEKWRPGRNVPPRTRQPPRENREITRKPPDVPGASARTILLERQNQNPMGLKSTSGPPMRTGLRSGRDRSHGEGCEGLAGVERGGII